MGSKLLQTVIFEEACSPHSMICTRHYDLYQRLQLQLCTPDDGRDGRPKHVE